MNPVKQTRLKVISFLRCLADKKAQRELDLPAEKIPVELARLWFEEIYAPSEIYLGDLRGDYSESKAQEFKNCFSVEELEALERFHRFFELRMGFLKNPEIDLNGALNSDVWIHMQKDAVLALDVFI